MEKFEQFVSKATPALFQPSKLEQILLAIQNTKDNAELDNLKQQLHDELFRGLKGNL